MEFRFLHFYPDLMSLYGSYANVSVLKRYLERLGRAVTVTAPGACSTESTSRRHVRSRSIGRRPSR